MENEEIKVNEDEILTDDKGQEYYEVGLGDLTKEQLIDVIEDLTSRPQIDVNVENIQDKSIDEEEYNNGLKIGSFYLGMFKALENTTLDNEQIYNLLLNESTCRHNIRLAKINSEIEKNNLV